jgi:hypothetical protein
MEQSAHINPTSAVDNTGSEASIREIIQIRQIRTKVYKESKSKLLASQERAWLRKHGKDKYIDFDDAIRNELRKYFLAMDTNGDGTIGLDELMEPLIALGLAENRQQVKAMFDIVDLDKSGKIEFNEFLAILRFGEGELPMADFFRKLSDGSLVPDAKVLPFKLVVSNYRRVMLMEAVLGDNPTLKTQGEKIMRAFSKQVEIQNSRKGLVSSQKRSSSEAPRRMTGLKRGRVS